MNLNEIPTNEPHAGLIAWLNERWAEDGYEWRLHDGMLQWRLPDGYYKDWQIEGPPERAARTYGYNPEHESGR